MRADCTAEFRFYGALNDFLPLAQRQLTVHYRFSGNPGIKDPIEALGVPHTEVELIIVNGEAIGFDYQLQATDRIAAFPVFHNLDISPVLCVITSYSIHYTKLYDRLRFCAASGLSP